MDSIYTPVFARENPRHKAGVSARSELKGHQSARAHVGRPYRSRRRHPAGP